MSESSTAEKWINQVLTDDATLALSVGDRIYPYQAPQGAARPFLIYALISGDDVNAIGARALAQPLFEIVAVGEAGKPVALRAAADRVDVLFQDAQATLDGQRLRCKRQREVNYPEDFQGIRYQHVGGMYRIWVSPAS